MRRCRQIWFPVLFLAVVMVLWAVASCAETSGHKTEWSRPQAAVREGNGIPESPEAFTGYIHDPRENPVAMRDIVENPDAVYGFSPSPAEESTLKKYADAIDWTDPDQVADAREQRRQYHESMEELYDMILAMVEEDLDIETIARAVSQRRNEIRMESYANDPDGLALLKQRNLETYGNEFGPTQDALYEEYGSWEMVLIKALGSNPGMDACLGFYDEYYYLYDMEEPEE